MPMFTFNAPGTQETVISDNETHITITGTIGGATVKIKPWIDGAFREFTGYNYTTAPQNVFLRLHKYGRRRVQISVEGGSPSGLIVGIDPENGMV